MVNKAGLRREAREDKSRINNGIATCGAILIGLGLFALPRTSMCIALDLSFALLVSLYCVWHCWGWSPTWIKRITFLLIHIGVLTAVGYAVWPRLEVTPPHVHFMAGTEQQYDFKVTNQTEDDYYQISVPIDVQGKPDSDFSLYLWPSEEDSRSVQLAPENANEYSYCIEDKTQKAFVFANIAHLEPHQTQRFTLRHKGSELTATVGEPFKYTNPVSYNKDVTEDGHLQETGSIHIPTGYKCHVILQAKERRQS